MDIKVLGTGCAKCKALEAVTKDAVGEMGVQAEITKVSDIKDIMSYPITMTPALVVNEKVVLSGKVPSKAEMIALLQKSMVK